ncbi:MAG: hypothetical protein JSV11_04660 [Nitrospiraceae bacterium]|nr:MAG: hypothetical protein JSU99_04315 [Nitrospiraceae bacterium]UCH46005.1 MAG: hypothetical protein JSV11_04660 [Nitrospiraceae bacterium]
MNKLMENNTAKNELLSAIRNSIGDARDSVQKLENVFKSNVTSLRVEESEEVFQNLSQNIHDLQYFMEFVNELKNATTCFDNFNLPADPISSDNIGANLFHEMANAFMSNDWIMLSDLIEYELTPMLLQEDEWLRTLGDRVDRCESERC